MSNQYYDKKKLEKSRFFKLEDGKIINIYMISHIYFDGNRYRVYFIDEFITINDFEYSALCNLLILIDLTEEIKNIKSKIEWEERVNIRNEEAKKEYLKSSELTSKLKDINFRNSILSKINESGFRNIKLPFATKNSIITRSIKNDRLAEILITHFNDIYESEKLN